MDDSLVKRLRRAFASAAVPLFVLLLGVSTWARASEPITVFAAASLQDALREAAQRWVERGGAPLRFSFAASSALARQIEQGAPAAVFASADEQWMDYLAQRKLIAEGTRRSLLGNRLALVVPVANPVVLEIKPGFDLVALLGAEGRWVTGDPASVPAGRYAQQALTYLGAWPAAQGRLVRAENVRVALSFVERGEVGAGIVYETDAAASRKVRIAAIFPVDSHAPISYPFAVIARNDAPAARALIDFLASPTAAEVWGRHGFRVR